MSQHRAPIWPALPNASLHAALAFNFVYFVQEFFLAWPKSRLPGVSAVVYHNNHGWSGEHPDILIFQGTGALAIIVLGLLVGAIVLLRPGRRLAPTLWWVALMALGLGLIQVPIAAMHPDNDVGQAMEHLAWSDNFRIALAAAACVMAIGFGVGLARPLLAMAPAGSVATPGSRVRYVALFGMLALAVGTVIAWANRAPPLNHLTMPFFSGLILLPWTLAAATLVSAPEPKNASPLYVRFDWPLLAANLGLLAFYRLVLAPGLWV